MVTAPTPNPKPSPRGSPKRPPLLPAPNNAPPPPREVTSRYLSSPSLSSSFSSNSSSSSSISSRRSQSPMAARRHASPTPSRRSQSVERRRTPTPMPLNSSAARVLMTSTRSLSVSFQGEAFKLPLSKAKPAPVQDSGGFSSLRRGTPERRKANTAVKDQREEMKIGDQYRWPGRSKGMNSSVLTRSLDFGADKSKLFGSGNGIRDLQNSVIKSKRETRLKTDSMNGELPRKAQCTDEEFWFEFD